MPAYHHVELASGQGPHRRAVQETQPGARGRDQTRSRCVPFTRRTSSILCAIREKTNDGRSIGVLLTAVIRGVRAVRLRSSAGTGTRFVWIEVVPRL